MFRSCLFRARLGFGARPCRFRALVLAFAVAICSPDALRIGWLLFCPSAARCVVPQVGPPSCEFVAGSCGIRARPRSLSFWRV